MIITQFITNLILFIIGFFGVTFNQKNILITLMGIELMLLSSNLNFIFFSIYLDDILGNVFSIFILTIAASEAAIGLAILIIFYKLKGTLKMTNNIISKY